MRTKNSIINIIVGWGTQVIKIIAGFIARTIFIKYLSVEYLGLSSTFTNILQILSFAELGIGGAILVSLYKPIANEDYDEQIALYQLYEKIFRVIGIVIIIAGVLLTPFLDFFIKDIPDIPHISLIYIMFVLNSAFSYFMAHKSTYFTAVQKNYVIRLVHSFVYVSMLIIQTVVLVITKNYILYLSVQLLATIAENVIWSILIKRQYPFLCVKEKKDINQEDKRQLMVNVKAVIFFKVGHIIVNSTDNLVLSKFAGLVVAGIYSNYYMIIMAVDSILNQIFTAIAASVGDLHVSSDEERQKDIFEKIMFLGFILYSVSMILMGNLLNDVINIWLGEEFLFPGYVVTILCLSSCLQGLRKVLVMFREACGLYDYTKYTTLFEAVANLILSIIFVKVFGVAGIFLGTIVSYLMFGFWKEPLVIYKYVLKSSVKDYWKKYLLYIISLAAIYIVMNKLGSAICVTSWLVLLIKAAVLGILTGGILILLFFRTKEFKYYYELLIKIAKVVRK